MELYSSDIHIGRKSCIPSANSSIKLVSPFRSLFIHHIRIHHYITLYAQDFLLLDEYKPLNISIESSMECSLKDSEYFITCNQATLRCLSSSPRASTSKDDRMTLQDVSFTAQGGQIFAIVGKVGSGKVSFF